MVEHSDRYSYKHLHVDAQTGVVDLGDHAEEVGRLFADWFGVPEAISNDQVKENCSYVWTDVILALDDDGKTVGYGSLVVSQQRETEVTLAEVYVDPQHRRRGIYRNFVDQSVNIAHARGARQIAVQVDESFQGFFEGRGFQRSERRSGVGIIMERNIEYDI